MRPIECFNPSITLIPKVIVCPYYQPEKKKDRVMKRVAIIVPIKYMITEDGGTLVTWACSFGKTCYYPKCRYSRGYQQNEKQKVI